jgi:hypothetical protein
MLSETATMSILRIVSLDCDTGLPPLNVGLDHEMVNEGSEEVREQDREHYAFRERRIHDPDENRHNPDEDTENPASDIGH